MRKFKMFVAIAPAVLLFNCAEIGESAIDVNSDSYIPEMAVDADGDGRADALQYSSSGVQNYKDSVYLASHPELVAALLEHDPELAAELGLAEDGDEPTGTGPIGSIAFTLDQVAYTIVEGGTFDIQKDISFSILDENKTDFTADAVISGEYDVDKPGVYTITISFEGIEKQVTLTVEEGYKDGEFWLSLNGTIYTINEGETFDPATDIRFEAKDEEGNDASGDVEFIYDGDLTEVGRYIITLEYEGIEKEVSLTVLAEGEDPVTDPGTGDPDDDGNDVNLENFTVTMDHDGRVNDTLIKVNEGDYFDNPTITAKTLNGVDVIPVLGDEDNIIGNTAKTGTYALQWNLSDPDDASTWAIYLVTVVVVGEPTITWSEDVDDAFNVKLGESYTLPTAEGVDGEGNSFDITVDDGGFDTDSEGEYTVVYKDADGVTIRTLVITVTDVETFVVNDEIEIAEAGTFQIELTKPSGIVWFKPLVNGSGPVTISGDISISSTYYQAETLSAGVYTITIDGPIAIGYQ